MNWYTNKFTVFYSFEQIMCHGHINQTL